MNDLIQAIILALTQLTQQNQVEIDLIAQLQAQLAQAQVQAPVHVSVVDSAGLTQALSNPAGGTIIDIAPGVYQGHFVLPPHEGEPITVSLAGGCEIPTRTEPALPQLVSPDNQPALQAAQGAGRYVISCLDIGSLSSAGTALATAVGPVTSPDQWAHDISFSRIRIIGSDAGLKRCFGMHGVDISLKESYLANCVAVGQDAQAVWVNWGPGPYSIVDNYLEASGENILFGGDNAGYPDLVPADIIITGNTLFKPLGWRTTSWSIKNLLELKNAKRVLIDHNIFDGAWKAAQVGYAVLFTPKNQYNQEPWTTVEDITFTHNTIRNASNGINITGNDPNSYPSGRTTNIVIEDNTIQANKTLLGGDGRCLMIGRGLAGLRFNRNLCQTDGASTIYIYGGGPDPLISGAVITANTWNQNTYGLTGEGTTGNAINTLNVWFPGVVFESNTVIGGSASKYPIGTIIQ